MAVPSACHSESADMSSGRALQRVGRRPGMVARRHASSLAGSTTYARSERNPAAQESKRTQRSERTRQRERTRRSEGTQRSGHPNEPGGANEPSATDDARGANGSAGGGIQTNPVEQRPHARVQTNRAKPHPSATAGRRIQTLHAWQIQTNPAAWKSQRTQRAWKSEGTQRGGSPHEPSGRGNPNEPSRMAIRTLCLTMPAGRGQRSIDPARAREARPVRLQLRPQALV